MPFAARFTGRETARCARERMEEPAKAEGVTGLERAKGTALARLSQSLPTIAWVSDE